MMKRLLPLLMLLLATLMGCAGQGMPSVVPGAAGSIVAAQTGSLALLTGKQQGHRHLAMLTDARNTYRLCGHRPQRLLPSHGSKPGKTTGRFAPVRRPHLNHFFFLHDGRRRLETAPFQTAASRDYYVFALRRILC